MNWSGGLKRVIDVTTAMAGLLVLAPALVALAVAIRLTMGRPILFRQVRPGWRGRPFELVKFRTMRAGQGSDDERLTPLGRFLRRTSLDELPQLWNVVRGELSLVGPRPLLMTYLSRYTAGQSRRHEVKPGITGWAQVNGRNALGWDEKFALDLWYVDHWSLRLDLRILALTLIKVSRQSGISQPGHATMPEFLGEPRP